MKNQVLYITVQPEAEQANWFWVNNIKLGIFDSAKDLQYTPCNLSLDAPDSLPMLSGMPVLVVGNDEVWLETTLRKLTRLGACGIIVNGSMQESDIRAHSGVIFELDRAIKRSLKRLTAAGRERTALLGVNPRSTSDLCKSKAFGNPESIIWAHDKMEVCVLDFIKHFKDWGYDSVICANDTVAIFLIQNMTEQGFRLPEELYVVGMGNSYLGSVLPLSLTSIDFDYYQMGKTAIKLYGFLKENPDCGNIVSHLPCQLITRQSAPITEQVNASVSGQDTPKPQAQYFSGKNAQSIVRAEAILQACNEIDREIIFNLLAGRNVERIAEILFLTTRAVRYRIANLVKKYDFSDKTELINTFNNAIKIDLE